MKWIHNLRMKAKLISAFVVVALLLTFVGLFGLNNMSKLSDGMSGMYHNNVIPISELSSIQIFYGQMRFNIIFMNTLAAPADRSKNEEAIKDLRKQIDQNIADYRNGHITQAEKESLNKFDPA